MQIIIVVFVVNMSDILCRCSGREVDLLPTTNILSCSAVCWSWDCTIRSCLIVADIGESEVSHRQPNSKTQARLVSHSHFFQDPRAFVQDAKDKDKESVLPYVKNSQRETQQRAQHRQQQERKLTSKPSEDYENDNDHNVNEEGRIREQLWLSALIRYINFILRGSTRLTRKNLTRT